MNAEYHRGEKYSHLGFALFTQFDSNIIFNYGYVLCDCMARDMKNVFHGFQQYGINA